MAPIITDVYNWIAENKIAFKPPICNKLLHQDGQLKVFFVGGPNDRKDFHIEEGEEFFFMLKGDMCLKVMEMGEFKDILIKEGDVFLLPGRIPHSPQRKSDTMGLVIERERKTEELDGLRYFVENSKSILFERWFHCENLGPQLSKIIGEFFNSEEFRSGKAAAVASPKDNAGSKPPYEIDEKRQLINPFSLTRWINENRSEIRKNGGKSLFGNDFKSQIEVIGVGNHRGGGEGIKNEIETYFWQLEGTSTLKVNGNEFELKTFSSALLKIKESWELINGVDDFTLRIQMKP